MTSWDWYKHPKKKVQVGKKASIKCIQDSMSGRVKKRGQWIQGIGREEE